MLSSLDITRILTESSASLIGAEVAALEYYRKERTFQLYVKGEKRYCATLSFHPEGSGFFILPAGAGRVDTVEKPRPFARDLTGGVIADIRQLPNDRMVEFAVSAAGVTRFLIFEVLGPNGNVWHLDDKRLMMESLRDKRFTPGEPYHPASLPPKLDPSMVGADDLKTLFGGHPETNPARLLEKNIYGIDYDLARTIIGGATQVEDINDDGSVRQIAETLRSIVARYRQIREPIFAYVIKGKAAFYPVELSGINAVGQYKSLSEAQREMLGRVRENGRTDDLREKTEKGILDRIRRLTRQLHNVETDIDRAAGFERDRQFADLLKISLARLRRGMVSITVDDLYHEGAPVAIPLNPKFSGTENIEMYSRRYRKGKEGLALLRRRRGITAEELASLEKAQAAFAADFDRAAASFPDLLPRTAVAKGVTPPTRRPYREFQTTTGLTIFVGRAGSDNDRTTFEYARPYDLWFHASQCPGSHVVMRYPDKSFEPSRREIEETAAIAAHFSKARGAGRVPVSYTLKRYVRKPRQGKPGLVVIDHEKTIMVAPREPSKNAGIAGGE